MPSPAEIEALKTGIMAEIEAKLSNKEDNLWKRGQVEIKRLQTDHQQVKDSIGQLQDKQSSLLTENKQIRGALLEVTTRFELVVKEMREVLRALPQQRGTVTTGTIASVSRVAFQPSPSPSVASTTASEALRDDLSPDTSYDQIGSSERSGARATPSTGVRSQQSPGVSAKQTIEAELRKDMGAATFCTPPRNDMAAAKDSGLDGGVVGSPAVLSLANSLPAASTPNSSACKRLQLAECLDGQASTPMPSVGSLPAPRSPPATRHAEPTSAARQFDFVNVEVVKEAGLVTLGIEVNQVDGVSLCVESVDDDGLVGRHNAQLPTASASRVLVNDRIMEVNGVKGNPNLMLQECKGSQRLNFIICRGRKACDGGAAPEQVASPSGKKLRPEASVFVPASQAAQEVRAAPPCVLPAVGGVPPGFENFDTGLLTLPTTSALGTHFTSMMEAAACVGGPRLQVPTPSVALGMACAGSPDYVEEEEVKRALFP